MAKILLLISVLFQLLFFSFQGQAQCNTNTTICTTGTAGPFSFHTPSGNPSSCLDFWNGNTANYGYIILYITASGSLDLLIQGSNAGSGCLDVSIFDITNQTNPCGSLSTGTEIACNYVSPCEGCAEFGNAGLGCNAIVDAGEVYAGDVIMILVEDWSDLQNSFTLELGTNPNSAQTGIPDATLRPESLGPFCTSDGLMQLLAVNNGGTWSGPGVTATGMFNPATAGPGVHTINYSIGTAPCNASSTAQITVGSIIITGMNVGACAGGTHDVSGNIQVVTPPSTGQLIVENCAGQQTVVATAPFTVGSYPFNLTGLTANAAACNLHAYFTGSDCSHILNYTAPTCPPGCAISSVTANPGTCQAGNTYTLTGAINFVDPPATGQLIVQTCDGTSVTYNAPFTSPLNYSIPNLTANGQSCSVTAHFSAQSSCSRTQNYTALAVPVVVASADVSICSGVSANISATGATTYSWNNGAGTNASATVSPTTTTTYTVTGTTNGCTATDQVVVTVNGGSAIVASADAAVCQGYSTTISATGGASYMWDNGLGSGASHTVFPSTTTTYNVTGTDINGCVGTDQVTVTVNPNPILMGSHVSMCDSETEVIQVSGADSYSWSPSTYLSSSTGSSVTFTPGVTTTYIITGTTTSGCVGTTSITATVYPGPVIEAGSDVVTCEGNSIVLTGTGAGTGGSYVWNNGVSNGLPHTPIAGTTVYTVEGTSADGCQGEDSVTVTVEQAPTISFTAIQDQLCTPATAVFQNTSSPGVNCIWTFDNGQTVNGCGPITQTFTNPGSYGATLQMESPSGCVSVLYQDDLVIVHPNPIASFTANPTIFSVGTPQVQFNNTSTGGTSYLWDFGDGSHSNEFSPNHTYPSEVAGYVVDLFVYNDAGCVDSASLSVRSEEDLIFYIPNTFTPDGDEFNQVFLPVFTSGFDPFDYTLLIYNRWGELVFESHDHQVGWDGTYGAKKVQEGMYTWKIEFKTIKNDERKMRVGHLNLIR